MTTKEQIIRDNRIHDSDTGSSKVQVAVLTERINKISRHLQANKHDYSTKRGLLELVARRKSILLYLNRTDPKAYVEIRQKLSIRA